MPNWCIDGTGEEGDENGQHYRQVVRETKEFLDNQRYQRRQTARESGELPTWNPDKQRYD